MELHELGPVKLFDTAGIDEAGQLGEKKRRKTLSALKECDVGVVVVDINRQQALLRAAGLQESSSSDGVLTQHLQEALKWEQGVLSDAAHYGVVPLLLLNLKGCKPGPDTQALVRAIQVWSGVYVAQQFRSETLFQAKGLLTAWCCDQLLRSNLKQCRPGPHTQALVQAMLV
jgi:hypothetical protein